MMTTAAITSLTRARAYALVERAERQTGSRMAAYEMVAQTVGVSSSWLRRLIKGYEETEPRASLFENIRVNYESLCSRVEQENELDEQRLRLLARKPNEIDEGALAQAGSKNQIKKGG